MPKSMMARVHTRGVVAGSAFLWAAVLAAVSLSLSACRSGEDAMLRGDRYWADSNYVAALAEYRLAAKQGGRPEAQARVAHAYIATGQLDRALSSYEALLRVTDSYLDQAIFDFVSLAREDLQSGDRYGAARAAQAALDLRPGLAIPDMALTLARHYVTIGDADRALQFYHRALSTADAESRNGLLYEIASLTERSGNCEQALSYFRTFAQTSTSPDSVTEARWRMGTCGLERGRRAREAGDLEHALELLQIPINLGAPQNQLDQAWFERGETLMALNRVSEAEQAYQHVVELSAGGPSQLAVRASRRLLEIRSRPVP